MRIVFMGTPSFSATILENLIQHHEVVAVYTRPDAVRGRGKRLEPSPVKVLAEQYGIPVHECRSLRSEDTLNELALYAPDVICVAAFGAIVPKAVLDLPRYGCLNVHASLLPRWRGAAPVERAILAGDKETGVCVMRMEESLDTGAFCVCRTTGIGTLSASELTGELALLGSLALLTALVQLEQGGCTWTEQDETRITYADKIAKGELNLSVHDTGSTMSRKVQASSDAHPARAVLAGRHVTILGLSASLDEHTKAMLSDMKAGEIRFVAKRLFLGAKDVPVEVSALKPDGKKSMDARAFAAGVPGIKNGGLVWGELR